MDKDLHGFYSARVSSLRGDIARLKRRNCMFVAAELTTFVAAVAFVAAYTVYGGMPSLVVAATMAVGYVVARRLDVRNSERMEWLVAVCSVYENELCYLAGDFTPFDDGRSYVDAAHPFTYDMDIFGPQSLFHRINRTVTSGGSDRLAAMLSSLPCDDEIAKNAGAVLDEMAENCDFGTFGDRNHDCSDGMGEKAPGDMESSDLIDAIDRRRATVDSLAANEPLRTEFIARAHGERVDSASVRAALDEVKRVPIPRFACSFPVLVVAWLALVGFLASVLFSIFTPMSSAIPVLWGTILLFVQLMLCNAPLRSIGKSAGRLQREMRAYGELIDTVMARGGDGELSSRRDALAEARRAFADLRAILDGLDRRGNVLGMVLFDVFLLSDFFLVRRFYRWRDSYIGRVGGWISRVDEIDALVSMATFRYNEPQAGSAEIVSGAGVVYEGRGLWHPFLGGKAVRNDFTVADTHYYIVTGANMAGKSTFLRSLGINYILAMNGMPVFAERLRVSIFSLFSSMRTSDDLSRGISYFNAELLRLKQLIDHCRQHGHTLIILDEILKGTNSLDKLNGSRMFLDAISCMPVSGVIATHDLELSKMADSESGRFHNWCFEIQLADKITYTYKIAPGVARNQNATYLLRNIIAGIGTGTKN